MSAYVAGFHNDIAQAVWKRPMTLGAPRLWSNLWLALCLYAGLMTLFLIGMTWLLLPIVGWAIGQGTLIVLTQFDAQWDDVLFAHLGRRYQTWYDAG